MSRFSKSAAEKAGWRFVHAQEEQTVRSRDTQGRTQTLAPTYIAEKTQETAVGGETLIHEEADSMGLLLERIHAYEERLGNLEPVEVPAPEPYGGLPEVEYKDLSKKESEEEDPRPLLAATGEEHIATVSTPDGNLTEQEFQARSSDEAKAAHAEFLDRQREAELAKPIDPQPTETEAVVPDEEEPEEPKGKAKK